MSPANTPVIELENLSFAWPGHAPVLALESLQLARGEQVFLRGPSGSGKSTLLNLIGGLMCVRTGDIRLLGQPFSRLSQRQRDRFRSDHIGVLFQQFNLLPYMSLMENILLPCRFSERRRQRCITHAGSPEAEAMQLLEHLQLGDFIRQPRPVSTLSIGQQQRVAAARALIGHPEIILADEPTSALDTDTRDQFIELLLSRSRAHQSTVIFVSHDLSLSRHFDRILDLPQLNRLSREAC